MFSVNWIDLRDISVFFALISCASWLHHCDCAGPHGEDVEVTQVSLQLRQPSAVSPAPPCQCQLPSESGYHRLVQHPQQHVGYAVK